MFVCLCVCVCVLFIINASAIFHRHRRLIQEKEEIEEEYMQYRREMKNTNSGTAAKEIRTLKGVVRNMEDQMIGKVLSANVTRAAEKASGLVKFTFQLN